MFISIPDIYQEAGFIFQVEIGYINCSENNIFFSTNYIGKFFIYG